MSGISDVLVIGAGVSGACVARRLSAYELDVVLVDREPDVSFGTSKANSGIVHGGFHHSGAKLKARLEIQGNLMFDRLKRELDFPFERCGIVVAALHDEEMRAIEQLHRQGLENGAVGIEMCSRERILELEPALGPEVVGGLHAPGGGIVEPYRFVFAVVESALKNGVALRTGFKAVRAERVGEIWRVHAEDGRAIDARWVVNAAGLYADEVSALFGAEDFAIKPRKGEYYLLDRAARAKPRKVVFPVPSANSKGMLVIPTVEGTVLVGPTADDVGDKGDFGTTRERLERILASARSLVPAVSEADVIASFAGLRPVSGDDFYIDLSARAPNLVQVAGIQSPGLTASPAIGEYVKDLLKKGGLRLVEKASYDPFLEPKPRVRETDAFGIDRLVAEDPAYGNIVCRCERVSEAEIVAAIRAGHDTLDGIKYFTRAQMGRCQGGFCTYRIVKIIMRETGKDWDEVTKRGGASRLVEGEL